jgi:hypothetical protein
VGKAGGSARRQYERRIELHKQRVRQLLPIAAALGIIAGMVGWFLAAEFMPELKIWIAATLGIGTVLYLLPNRQSADAYGIGARGEEKVGAELEKLPASYVVFHDVKMPRSRENIDHIVFGPTGVFVVETKAVAGSVTVDDGAIFVGRRRSSYVEQVWRQASALQGPLSELLADKGLDVQPIVCFTRAELPLFRTELNGLLLLGPKGTRRHIAGRAPVFSEEEIETLVSKAERSLRLTREG